MSVISRHCKKCGSKLSDLNLGQTCFRHGDALLKPSKHSKPSPKLTDWAAILQATNKQPQYNFKSVKSMLQDLHKINKSAYITAEMLGLSRATVYQKMKELDVPVKPRGRQSKYLPKIQEIKNVQDMTAREIAQEIGSSKAGAVYILEAYKIPYRVVDSARGAA